MIDLLLSFIFVASLSFFLTLFSCFILCSSLWFLRRESSTVVEREPYSLGQEIRGYYFLSSSYLSRFLSLLIFKKGRKRSSNDRFCKGI